MEEAVLFIVETTPHCLRARFLLFALEECAVPYELELREPGYFLSSRDGVGPLLRHGSVELTEINVALARIADVAEQLLPAELEGRLAVQQWLELQATWMRPAGVRLYRARQEGLRDEDAEKTLARCLRRHEAALRQGPYLLGAFTLADCTAPFLMSLRDGGHPLEDYPAVRAYLQRIEQRPALERARERSAASAARDPFPSLIQHEVTMHALHASRFENPAIWNQVADSYTSLLLPMFDSCAKRVVEILAPAADAVALDLACGPGTATLHLSPRVSRVDAVDFSRNMLEQLRARAAAAGCHNVNVLRMDGHDLELPAECYDVVVSMFGVVHFADPERGLAEAFRVTKPGGKVAISTWASVQESEMPRLMLAALKHARVDLPPDEAVFHQHKEDGGVTHLLERAGFVAVEQHRLTQTSEVPSAAKLWGGMIQSAVPLVLLRNHTPAERWAEISEQALAYLETAVTWPHATSSTAYAATGVKPR